METTTDSVMLTTSPVKTENIVSPGTCVNLKQLTSNTVTHVGKGKRPPTTNNIETNILENTIYNLMCPWDYLVNFSNVSVNVNNNPKYSTSCNRQLESLINNFELLISQFKVLIESTCSVHLNPSGVTGNEALINNTGKTINLPDNLSMLLGHPTTSHVRLIIKNENKISSEYHRSSKVLDSVIETITYKDLTETLCADEDLPQLTGRKEEIGSDNDGDTYIESVFEIGKTRASTLKPNENKYINTTENSSDSTTESISQKKFRPYEPLGFKSEFCITEEVYDDIINKGSPYTCPSCEKVFKDRRNFEHHLNGRCIGVPSKGMKWEPKWKKENGRLHCLFEGCNETYTHKQSLYKHHQRAHLKDAVDLPFKCNQCDKSFIIKSILSIHIQELHTEKVRKCCEICGASVRSNTDLKLHMRRRHTGEMPYKCEYCEFRGVNISSVKRHTRLKHETHLLTFHCCDICGKQFKTKANLKEHIPTHSDKRTFLCKICGKCLKNDCSYRRHMVCVHGIKFTCELCGKDYSAVIGLKVHQRNVHGINS